MLITAKADYVAGGWPGEVYRGEVTVSLNANEYDDTEEINEELAIRARRKVADELCFTTASVRISNLRRVANADESRE